ncbi:efflux RND transporter permease subunit [Limibacter armeniacum]|uniref:efflux RND transporter permease subunit n=1 Tax=Limibacter armeniacum TaxID=466084 RepID=UPI002FE571D7
MTVTEIAIKRPALVIVVFTVLGLLGMLSYQQLNYNLLPDFDAPVMTIATVYPGAAASEVETSVTKEIEDALSSLENLDKLESTSQEGISLVVVRLYQNADIDQAVQDAQRKIDAIQSELPEDVDASSISKFSTADLPVLQLGVTADLAPTAFYQLMDDRIKPQLAKIEGVGQISLVGGEQREIQVNVDPAKLKAYKLTIGQVSQAITAANQDFPTGKIETQNSQYSLRMAAKFSNLNQIRNLIITTTADGAQVRVDDVAEVNDGIAEQTTINRVNGRTSIGVVIQKQADANAVAVSEMVRKKLTEIESTYAAENLHFTIANDSSVYTLASADAVMFDLVLAVVIVAVVMLFFLHSMRNSLIVLVALPTSIVSTFILMYLFGFSLNLMTLLALSLVVGILVDDSIVVLENIYRHMEMGKHKRIAALEGRNEIGFTAMAITLVDVVVFVPMSLVSGLVGNIVREFSLVVVFSTLMSLVVSFTITPLLASRFGKLTHLDPKGGMWSRILIGFESGFDGLKDTYSAMLSWVLNGKRWVVYLSTVALFVASLALVPAGFIGAEFTPQADRGEMVITLEYDPEVTIYQNNQKTTQVEKLLLARPEVEKVMSNIGYGGSTIGGASTNYKSQLTVTLVDKKHRNFSTTDFGITMQKEIMRIPGIKAKAAPTSIVGGAGDAPIQISVKGTDMDQIRETAEMIKGIVANTAGTSDVEFSIEDPKPEIQVQVDRDKMANLGLNVGTVGSTLRTAFSGNDDSRFSENPYEYDIMVRLDGFNRSSLQDVNNLSFVNSQGQVIPLSQFADVRQELGASKLERKDRQSSITVNAQVVGRPVGTVGAEIQAAVAQQNIPESLEVAYGGQLEQQSDAFGSLGLAMLMAIILVYLIMAALYDNFIDPFIVLFSLPVALIGALLALALTMSSLSIFSIIGLIMLMGLVAKNAILLVDFANHLLEQGMEMKEALVEAGRERLRPILMTTLAMVFGMLPIAMASGAGAETRNGLAWAIIGGLISSLILTLVLVPSVYMTIKRRVVKWQKKRSDETEKTELALSNA